MISRYSSLAVIVHLFSISPPIPTRSDASSTRCPPNDVTSMWIYPYPLTKQWIDSKKNLKFRLWPHLVAPSYPALSPRLCHAFWGVNLPCKCSQRGWSTYEGPNKPLEIILYLITTQNSDKKIYSTDQQWNFKQILLF